MQVPARVLFHSRTWFCKPTASQHIFLRPPLGHPKSCLSEFKKEAFKLEEGSREDEEGGKTKQDLMTSGRSDVHVLYSKGNESETSQHQPTRRNPSMVYKAVVLVSPPLEKHQVQILSHNC